MASTIRDNNHQSLVGEGVFRACRRLAASPVAGSFMCHDQDEHNQSRHGNEKDRDSGREICVRAGPLAPILFS
jgi:hypothetical protein